MMKEKVNNINDGSRYYELVLLCRSEASPEDIKSLFSSIKDIIIENNFKIVFTEYWGMRKLEYKINKYQNAHFYVLRFSSDLNTNNEIQKKIDINDVKIRNLLVKLDCDFDLDSVSPNLKDKDNIKSDQDSNIVFDERYKAILKFLV